MSENVKNYANKVLLSIGEPFISSSEEDMLPASLDDLKEVFIALFNILQDRHATQDVLNKLKAKALLEHISLEDGIEKKKYSSNILLGFGVDA